MVYGWNFLNGTTYLSTTVHNTSTGAGESAVTCVYAFLSCKTQEIYEELLHAVVDACERVAGFSPDPSSVIVDFEQAVMKAIPSVLGEHVSARGCFYHLTQSTWRKVQELGLSLDYKEDKDIKLFCGMLDGLAFLPLDKVTEGMLVIRNCIPIKSHDKLQELVDYFDTTYVSGPFRRVQLPPARSDTVAAPVRLRRLVAALCTSSVEHSRSDTNW